MLLITYAALCPHPPLLIPEIGRESISVVTATQTGIKALAAELLATQPDGLVFLTPHGNVFSDCISALGDAVLVGDFADFGSKVGTRVRNDLGLLQGIEAECNRKEISLLVINQAMSARHKLKHCLDHGVLVPLYYLQQAGMKDIPVIAISTAFLPLIELYTVGKIIKEVAAEQGKKVAIIASGDMSHRLKKEGPYDFHPDGARFDKSIQELLKDGDVLSILNISESLRNNAGECGYRSIVIMLGALDGNQISTNVFSYEGPFGVGYLVAGFKPVRKANSILIQWQIELREKIEAKRRLESKPVKWARMVLENNILRGAKPELPADLAILNDSKAGVFVSLKKHNQLRGCIGTIFPDHENLAQEIAANAISAGTRDPRFQPVETGELEDLVYSVDILGDPQTCERNDLDPSKYGVIVSSFNKRGLLLPELEGVDTVEQQLSIAVQKAGIKPGERYEIERFEVKRYT